MNQRTTNSASKNRPKAPWGPWTDTRLLNEQVKAACAETLPYQEGYWQGVLCCRADPGVRPVRIYYNEQLKGPRYRLFSYDEMIATSTLIRLGVPKRIAAAMAFYEVALAVPKDTGFCAGDRKAELFQAVSVRLSDGSLWDVAYEKDYGLSRLKFVGDFGVLFDESGKKSDPDKSPFPLGLLEIVSILDVVDVEAECACPTKS